MTARKRARIYIRESNERLVAAYSPGEMIRQCRDKAESLNADVVAEPIVEAAKRDEFDAPLLLEQLAAAERGEYDYLISWDMYRLTGELGKHLWFKQAIARTRVRVYYVTVEFPDSEEGELFETMTGALGRFERAKTRARTQNGIRGKLAAGRPICNGNAPYGLAKVYDGRRPIGYAPDPEQFPILERILRELRTDTMATVCDRLNAEGVPSPTGRARWQSGTLATILGNATYRGDYRFGVTKSVPTRDRDGKRKFVRTKHDASNVTALVIDQFIDLADLAAARAGLAERRTMRRGRFSEDEDAFTLRGRLRCGHCGGTLTSGRNMGRRRYVCRRAYPSASQLQDPGFVRCSGQLPIVRADDIETHAWDVLTARLSDRDALEAALVKAADGGEQRRRYDEQRASLRASIAKLTGRIANRALQLPDFDPSDDTYRLLLDGQRADEQTKRELTATLAELDERAPVVLSADDADAIRTMWDDLAAGIIDVGADPAAQRTVYRALEITATVTLADGEAGAVRLGRDHDFRIEWSGHVELCQSVKASGGALVLWHNSDDGSPSLALTFRAA